MFLNLRVDGWRQFKNVDINFHRRLTVLTGANGAGKTTLLNLIGSHFGWETDFVSTPVHGAKEQGVLKYIAGFWRGQHAVISTGERATVGAITYSDGSQAQLTTPAETGAIYNIHLAHAQHVNGLHIPSHRPVYTYQSVISIPTTPKTREYAFQQYAFVSKSRMRGRPAQQAANFYMKETLLSLAALGYGNQVVARNEEAVQTFEEFTEVLRAVLPPKLGFQRIAVRFPEVVLETRSGDFSLDGVSGGIASILDISWQVFMYAPRDAAFVVTLDEPENHLHPELQRTIVPSLVSAFPHAQFIVATHSPFVVSSVMDSNVYVLDYDAENRIRSTLLDTVNKAGTSNEILRDVLGLSFTMPLWVENRLNHIIEKYERQELNARTFAQLRAEMSEIGLEKLIPETIAQVVERNVPR